MKVKPFNFDCIIKQVTSHYWIVRHEARNFYLIQGFTLNPSMNPAGSFDEVQKHQTKRRRVHQPRAPA